MNVLWPFLTAEHRLPPSSALVAAPELLPAQGSGLSPGSPHSTHGEAGGAPLPRLYLFPPALHRGAGTLLPQPTEAELYQPVSHQCPLQGGLLSHAEKLHSSLSSQ